MRDDAEAQLDVRFGLGDPDGVDGVAPKSIDKDDIRRSCIFAGALSGYQCCCVGQFEILHSRRLQAWVSDEAVNCGQCGPTTEQVFLDIVGALDVHSCAFVYAQP